MYQSVWMNECYILVKKKTCANLHKIKKSIYYLILKYGGNSIVDALNIEFKMQG
jgi:hypothetical protein